MKCCGEERTKQYCPDCGKKLREYTREQELYNHITSLRGRAERYFDIADAKRTASRLSGSADLTPYWDGKCNYWEGMVRKYTAWLNIVEPLLPKEEAE